MGRIVFGNPSEETTIIYTADVATSPSTETIKQETITTEVIKEVEKLVEVPVIQEVEKIVIQEKIVEVPVIKEVIKEVEKIIEIPVIKIQEKLVEDTEKIEKLKAEIESVYLVNVDLSFRKTELELHVEKLKKTKLYLIGSLILLGVLYVTNL